MDARLSAVIDKYRTHPEFLGLEITDVNQPGAVDDTVLHIAARLGADEDIEVLVAGGANVNAVGDLGHTPLHGAAANGRVRTVRLLLSLGARPDIRNEFGETPLDVALMLARADVVSILRQTQEEGLKSQVSNPRLNFES